MRLAPFIAALPTPAPTGPPEDPWRHALWIAASYLVDDATHHRVLAALEAGLGLDPTQLASADPAELAALITPGGMSPPMRAGKVQRAASALLEAGLRGEGALRELAQREPARAARVLARCPGISPIVAQRVLVRAGALAGLPLESNGLRVLLRLGFGAETPRWESSLASAVAAVEDLPASPAECWRWLETLRQHGQRLCKRSPRCGDCPLRGDNSPPNHSSPAPPATTVLRSAGESSRVSCPSRQD